MTAAMASTDGRAYHGNSLFRATGLADGCRSKKTVRWPVTQRINVGSLTSAVALSRYQNIVEAPDFGDLDYESVDPKATKPTKGAIRVNDLLETITGMSSPTPPFQMRR